MSMQKIRHFALAAVFMTLTACQTVNPLKIYSYEKPAAQLPVVSLVVNNGYVFRMRNCGEYSCSTYTDNTGQFMLDDLRKSGLYERVDWNSPRDALKLDVQLTSQKNENEAWAFTKFILSLGTLFLVPAQQDYKYDVTVDVILAGQKLATYHYQRLVVESTFLFRDAQQDKANVIESVVSELNRDILANKELMATLNSSRHLEANRAVWGAEQI